ncbi:MAG: Crp/Fnr family transcriptional regulator [Bacteroidales bacterium]|nr:Crp/Fnr family transcriptional regulator [Bacteroidales bacterium]MCF8402623.1 Crp/Fnr family transcriptional regulator [Bacteroidales bacterium]
MKIIQPTGSCKSCTLKSLLFTKMTDKELEYLNGFRKEILFEKGESIIKEGTPINEFLYLKKGLVKLYKFGASQRERIISIARPRDFVSLISTFSSTKYQYSITALEESLVCSLQLESMKTVIRNNGGFALELIQHISRSSNNVIQSTFEIDDKHLRGRIAYILLWFSKKIYHNNIFTLPISRKEMGELINMTTENVIRILSEFRKDGLIKIDGKVIGVLNQDLLEKISKSG